MTFSTKISSSFVFPFDQKSCVLSYGGSNLYSVSQQWLPDFLVCLVGQLTTSFNFLKVFQKILAYIQFQLFSKIFLFKP